MTTTHNTEPKNTRTPDAQPREVAQACRCILEQCAGLTRHLDDKAYTQPSRVLKGGTIGQHLRHALDHVAAITDCTIGNSDGIIDYDHRKRGGAVETDRAQACSCIEGLCAQLAALDDDEFGRPVQVRFMFSGSGQQSVLGSTVGRELAFAMHHAIHHQAMIRAIVVEHGGTAPESFGMAPDTLRHQARACADATRDAKG